MQPSKLLWAEIWHNANTIHLGYLDSTFSCSVSDLLFLTLKTPAHLRRTSTSVARTNAVCRQYGCRRAYSTVREREWSSQREQRMALRYPWFNNIAGSFSFARNCDWSERKRSSLWGSRSDSARRLPTWTVPMGFSQPIGSVRTTGLVFTTHQMAGNQTVLYLLDWIVSFVSRSKMHYLSLKALLVWRRLT